MEITLDPYVTLIKDVGFPIAVAWFVLVRLNGKVGKLTDAVVKLTTVMTNFTVKFSADEEVERVQEQQRLEGVSQKLLDAQLGGFQRLLDAIGKLPQEVKALVVQKEP